MTKSILVVGPAWIGDMVMAQALFKALKQQSQTTVIDVLAPAWTHPLLARMPEVRQPILSPLSHGQLNLTQRWKLGKMLREQQYAEAYVLPNSWKSALIPFAARIPKRTGWRGEMRFGLLTDCRRLEKINYPRMVDRFTALAYPASYNYPKNDDSLKPKLTIAFDKQQIACEQYQLSTEKPVLALCPGAAFGYSKRWPAAYYAEIAQAKLKEGWQVWLFGSKAESSITHEINQATNYQCEDLAGKTTLAEAIDLMALSSVVVTNDSGLMHIAAALQRPLIAIYGSTSPDFTPPLSKQAEILSLTMDCHPCFQRECPKQHHECMRRLTSDKVLAAMNQMNLDIA